MVVVIDEKKLQKVFLSAHILGYYNDDIIYEDSLYSIEQRDNTDLKYQIDNIIQKWF